MGEPLSRRDFLKTAVTGAAALAGAATGSLIGAKRTESPSTIVEKPTGLKDTLEAIRNTELTEDQLFEGLRSGNLPEAFVFRFRTTVGGERTGLALCFRLGDETMIPATPDIGILAYTKHPSEFGWEEHELGAFFYFNPGSKGFPSSDGAFYMGKAIDYVPSRSTVQEANQVAIYSGEGRMYEVLREDLESKGGFLGTLG